MIAPFSLSSALVGGALLGLGLSVLFMLRRQPTGVSGVVAGVLAPVEGDLGWRLAVLFGLLGSGAVARVLVPAAVAFDIDRSMPALALAGALVGMGTRLANGCTSGHGVCGMGRLSPRSLVATAVFLGAGALTVLLTHRIGPGT